MNNRFNLVDENWIPIKGQTSASLSVVFTDDTLEEIGGTAVQKLAIIKLLLAIAQTALPIDSDKEWEQIGAEGLCTECQKYLQKHHEQFWLYGEHPFLQMPQLANIKDTKRHQPLPVLEIGKNYLPDLPADNDTILTQIQVSKPLSDADKALFVVSLMNYALGGKRIAKNVPSLTSLSLRSNSAKSAPSLGNFVGYLNSFILGRTIKETVWLNLLTSEQLSHFDAWTEKALPPWEKMPTSEDDEIARKLKNSFMGTLCAMSRFVLLKDKGVIYTEGIQYPSANDGWREPFIAWNNKGKMLWLDTARKPWRNLPSLLAMSFANKKDAFFCPQISLLFQRTRKVVPIFGIWSGGLEVRGNAGDQSVKQTDDFIDSQEFFDSKSLGDIWYITFKNELEELENIGKKLYGCVLNYYKDFKRDQRTIGPYAAKASTCFWSTCENYVQQLINSCNFPAQIHQLRITYAALAENTYNEFCPNKTARQMEIWIKNHPNFQQYLHTTK